uniref:Histone H2A n=1 Tax=Steinernema glaseri TaxID=37863 RepID=A0A1I7YUN5_9BILA
MAPGKLSSNGKGGKLVKHTQNVSRSDKAGVKFPVGRIHRMLRKGNYAQRIGSGAPVYLSAVLEYLVAEILELSGNAAMDHKKSRINPRHIMLAVRNDDELAKMLSNVTFSQGGVQANIHQDLLPNKPTKMGPSSHARDGDESD